jgi:hypothetical protein
MLSKVSAAHRQANEARNLAGERHPFSDRIFALSAAQHHATDFAPSAAARCRNDLLEVLFAVEAFDLPDVALHLRILKLLNGLDGQRGADFLLIGPPVTVNLVEMRLSGETSCSNMKRLELFSRR